MLASFTDELRKIAEGNVVAPKPAVGGLGSNAVAKPLPTPGISQSSALSKPKPAKPTNYTMVHSNTPMAAFDGSTAVKSIPPPSVET